MVIVFYDSQAELLYVATSTEPIQSIRIDDVEALEEIPDDDVIYVQNAHILNKQQLIAWTKGEYQIHTPVPAPSAHAVTPAHAVGDQGHPAYPGYPQQDPAGMPGQPQPIPGGNQEYIHTVADVPLVLGDIRTAEFPNGLVIQGKYDYIPINRIGKDVLEQSAHFRLAMKNKRIEIVNDDYVQKNAHKAKQKVRFQDSDLDRILIKDPTPGAAAGVAASGGLYYEDDPFYAPTVPMYGRTQQPGQFPGQVPGQGQHPGVVPLYPDR